MEIDGVQLCEEGIKQADSTIIATATWNIPTNY